MLETTEREIIITRLLNAPRELVFDAWTKPEHIVNWWGPTGFTTTDKGMDLRPDGVWRFILHGPDGRDYLNKIVFLEVKRPERLVYRHADDGETEPVSFHVTVTFTAVGNKTELKMVSLFPSAAELKRVNDVYGAVEGARETIQRLEEYLEKI